MEVDDPVGEASVILQWELHAGVVWERLVASPNDHRRNEQVIVVDQTGLHCLAGEVGASYRDVAVSDVLELADSARIEALRDPGLRARDRVQRGGIDDLVGRLPDPRIVLDV